MVNPLVRLDSASNLPWEKRADGRYWTHITLGVAGNRLDYWAVDKSGRPGKQTELVTGRGLYGDKSLKSLAQLPILLTHPKNKRYQLNREGLKVGQLTGNVFCTKTLAQFGDDEFPIQFLLARIEQSHQEPVSMHRRMPVKTSVEGWVQGARRLQIFFAIHI